MDQFGRKLIESLSLIKSLKKAWLKSYIYMITELSKNAKNYFEKDFFKLMNNWKNYRKHSKIYRYQICNNRKENKLFGVRTKLSHYKVFRRKCNGYSNAKKLKY